MIDIYLSCYEACNSSASNPSAQSSEEQATSDVRNLLGGAYYALIDCRPAFTAAVRDRHGGALEKIAVDIGRRLAKIVLKLLQALHRGLLGSKRADPDYAEVEASLRKVYKCALEQFQNFAPSRSGEAAEQLGAVASDLATASTSIDGSTRPSQAKSSTLESGGWLRAIRLNELLELLHSVRLLNEFFSRAAS